MTTGVNGWFRKLLTLILVGVWAVLILDLTSAEPTQLMMIGTTAFVFLLVGRMWGVEADHIMQRLNPISISFGDDDEQ